MKLYQIVERNGRKQETYVMGFETEAELTRWLRGKEAMQDERTYTILAWSIGSEGQGYIDLEKYWKLYSRKRCA